jgi:hypothetical protein
MTAPLETELKTYQSKREELLGAAEGKFVLICSNQVLGTFESKNDAITQGYSQCGNVPFLVKQVLRVEVPQNLVSNLLAI